MGLLFVHRLLLAGQLWDGITDLLDPIRAMQLKKICAHMLVTGTTVFHLTTLDWAIKRYQ